MTKPNLNDADVDMLISRFREIFFDKHETEEKIRDIVKEEVSHLPTKDEFYEEMAKLYKKQEDLEVEDEIKNFYFRVAPLE